MGRKLVVSGAKLPPDRAIGRDREGTSEPAEERAGELAPQA